MLSSRAICLICRSQANATAKSTRPLQTFRNLSSVSNSSSRAVPSTRNTARSNPSRFSLLASSRPLIRSDLPGLSRPPHIRFQSTLNDASATTSDVFASDPPSVPDQPSLVNAVTDNLDSSEQWYIGYLKEHGIEFGWLGMGPSSGMRWIFEHIIVWSGLSFGTSYLVMAISARLLIFPFIAMASEQSARHTKYKDELTVFQARIRGAQVEGDNMGMQRATRDMRAFKRQHGISTLLMSSGPLLQMPVMFSQWRLTRNMAWLPAPGVTTGGFLWFTNLAIPDATYMLPLLTGIVQHIGVRLGGASASEQQTNIQPWLRKFFLWGLPCLTVFIAYRQSAAVQLGFLTGSMFTCASSLVLRNAAVRSFLRMSPRPTGKPAAKNTVPTKYGGDITVHDKVIKNALGVKSKPTTKANRSPRTIRERLDQWRESLTESLKSVSNNGPMGALGVTSPKDRAAQSAKKQKQQLDIELQQKRNSQRKVQREQWEEENRRRQSR